MTLVIGGHIDRSDRGDTLLELVEAALRREMAEELGVEPPETLWLLPAGMVVDRLSSVEASRHVGLVHEAITLQPVIPGDYGEFKAGSNLAGKQFTQWDLLRFRREMDPWSRMILNGYILKPADWEII